MAEKYIDLEDRVFDEVANNSRTQCRRVLAWLDDHPDQVPGRTITERKVTEAFGPEYMAWARMCLSRIGVTVVPDPEPMPTIEFARDIMRFESGDPDTRGVPRWAVNMAAYLTDAGYVKAPEADDE